MAFWVFCQKALIGAESAEMKGTDLQIAKWLMLAII